MKENRILVRWFAGVTIVGALCVGGLAPAAQASTDHSSAKISKSASATPTPQARRDDTGWG